MNNEGTAVPVVLPCLRRYVPIWKWYVVGMCPAKEEGISKVPRRLLQVGYPSIRDRSHCLPNPRDHGYYVVLLHPEAIDFLTKVEASLRIESRSCTAHGREHAHRIWTWLSEALQKRHLEAKFSELKAKYFAERRYLSHKDRNTAARCGRDMEHIGADQFMVGNKSDEPDHLISRSCSVL